MAVARLRPMIGSALLLLVLSSQGSTRWDGVVHPRTYTSETGAWTLDVDPETRRAGPAVYRLFCGDRLVWEREQPWTLTEVLLTEHGLALGTAFRPYWGGGCAFDIRIWREKTYPVVALLPDGEARVLGRVPHASAPATLEAVPTRTGTGLRLTLATTSDLFFPVEHGELTRECDPPAEPLSLRPAPLLLPPPRRIKGEPLGAATLAFTGTVRHVRVDARGSLLVLDLRDQRIEVFDIHGRHLDTIRGLWEGLPMWVDTSEWGPSVGTTRGTWTSEPWLAEGTWTPGPDFHWTHSAHERPVTWKGTFTQVRRKGPDGEHAIVRAPTGHWLVRPRLGGAVAPDGTAIVLDQRRTRVELRSFLHVYDGDGRPRLSLQEPRATGELFLGSIATDGHWILRRLEDRLHLYAIDGSETLVLEISASHAHFSPDGQEIRVLDANPHGTGLRLRRYRTPR